MKANNNGTPARKSSWRWPLIIIGMLLLHISIMMTAVFLTLQRPGESAVISEYYDKAQAFDSYKARLSASDKLAWNVTLEQTGQLDSLSRRQMRLNLTDAQSQPIKGATVSVHCFHWSHGDEAAQLVGALAGPGQYVFSLPGKYVGFWQFDVTAQVGNDSFIKTFTQFAN